MIEQSLNVWRAKAMPISLKLNLRLELSSSILSLIRVLLDSSLPHRRF